MTIPYLDGCTNGMQLWLEICEQGYPGGYGQVIRWLRQQRHQSLETTLSTPDEAEIAVPGQSSASKKRLALPSNRQLAWLLLLNSKTLPVSDATLLRAVRQHPAIEQIYQLPQQFRRMIRQRQAADLDSWPETCVSSINSDLRTFAKGLLQDYSTVRAALETTWSNGPIEGHINRLKLLKRQMYGRAKLDLLRIRLLNPI